MSGIQTMTVKTGATMAPTGGTDLVFAPDGVSIQNGVHLTVPATAAYKDRQTATVKFRPPSLGSDGAYTKDKKSVSYSVPKTLASGVVVYNTIRIEREVHPEFTAAEALDLNVIGAQILCDSEAATFWSAGSLA
jgi:hypothetical protein